MRGPARAGARAVVGAALAWAIVGCAGEDDALHGAVHGTVRDLATGKALKGVSVEFVSDTLDQVDDMTDSRGRYVLNVAARTPSGRLTASKVGYETNTSSVFLDDGELMIDIALARE